MRATDESFFFKGDRVRLINLKGRSDLNGCECEILTGDPSSSQDDVRYAVRVLRGAAAEENILVRPKNMIDWLEEGSAAPAEAPPAVQTTRTAAAEGLSSSQPAHSSLPAAAAVAAAAAAAAVASSGGSKATAEAGSMIFRRPQPCSPKSPVKGAAPPSSEPGAGEKQQPRLRKDGVSVIEQLMTRCREGYHNPNRTPNPNPNPNHNPNPNPIPIPIP